MNFLKLIPLLACILLVACSSPEERAANYIDKAEALYADEDYVGAKIEAMNAAQIEPRNADARYLLAQIEEKQQNFRGAIGHLQVAVDANPNHVESRIKLGNYYVLAKAADLAEEQSIAAMELDPENPEARLLKARVAYLNEDLVTARTEVDTALIQDPGLVDGIMFKAGIDMAEDNLEGALELVDNGIANANAEGIKNLRQFKILMLRASQRNEEVEAELQALIKAYPDDDGFLLALAQLYAVEDRIDEAEQTYRQYIDKAPDDVERRITFAQFVGAQDGPERAEETLQAFIEELPDETVLQLALGQLYETIDSKDEALVVYENIVAMDPVSTDGLKARNRIAIIKLQQDKPEEARTMAESIIVDKPDDPDALLMRAAFSFSDRNYDDAVTDLRTVIRVKPESERALLL
ncbi:MAG: tetratricopeptide repeat protein, partial [Gammaproteobacteria bacterium]|nr:tetratricopeptide repeat protein [Gammaproteobacteria bacterium]